MLLLAVKLKSRTHTEWGLGLARVGDNVALWRAKIKANRARQLAVVGIVELERVALQAGGRESLDIECDSGVVSEEFRVLAFLALNMAPDHVIIVVDCTWLWKVELEHVRRRRGRSGVGSRE